MHIGVLFLVLFVGFQQHGISAEGRYKVHLDQKIQVARLKAYCIASLHPCPSIRRSYSWRDALWEYVLLPKNKTQGLLPGQKVDPESNAHFHISHFTLRTFRTYPFISFPSCSIYWTSLSGQNIHRESNRLFTLHTFHTSRFLHSTLHTFYASHFSHFTLYTLHTFHTSRFLRFALFTLHTSSWDVHSPKNWICLQKTCVRWKINTNFPSEPL